MTYRAAPSSNRRTAKNISGAEADKPQSISVTVRESKTELVVSETPRFHTDYTMRATT